MLLPTYHLLPTYVKTLPSSRHGNDYIFCNFQADKKIWCATLQQSNNCFYIHYIHTGTIKTMKKPGTTNTIPIWICTYLAWEYHKVGKIRVTTRKLTMHHDAFWNFFFVWLKMKHDADDPIYVLFYQFREFWCYPVTCNFWTTVERVEPAFDFVHGLIKQSTKS